MTQATNRQVLLKSRPKGIPQAENFEIQETAVPQIQDGRILIRNIYLSVEPAMRGWVSAVANYSEPVPIGGVMRAFATGRVDQSGHPDFVPGEFVTGMFGWQDYALVKPETIQRKVDPSLPISTSLGILGLNGLTAYFALLEVGRPEPGETIVVSSAAGAVGSCVGQIAKIKGCRTIGVTSSVAKAKICSDEFGYDAVVNYNSNDLERSIGRLCPDGVNVYYDNTAGSISDAVLQHISVGARIVICGTASVPSWDPPPLAPRVERRILVRRARMQGFLVFDYADRYDEALAILTDWVKSGKLRYREEITNGIESAPGSIASLYRSENMGKRLIRIAPE
ncbi:MAG: NADP-dependent oxidoreductase [Arenicellales bacterium]|nr:NADP-dependent oxidoreductase [Arenicellales bacterium]